MMNDLQGQKAKEPNNPQLDASIAEARNQLIHLAAAAEQHERQYTTPEAFAQYTNQFQLNLQQRRAELINNASTNSGSQLSSEQLRAMTAKSQQIANRMKEIEINLQQSEMPDDGRNTLRLEYQHFAQQLEQLKEIFHNQNPVRIAGAAGTPNQAEATNAGTSQPPPTPPLSQPQPPTPTSRNIPPTLQIQVSQPTVTQPASMSNLPHPSVNTTVPPARPTLTGGYPSGYPLLGSASPGIPHAFHLAQDGDTRLLSKRKLQDLVKSIDPDERLEPDVEELLMEVADEFIDSVLQQSCKIARHRKGQMLEVRDVQLHLERNWNIRIPGYSSEEVRSVKK